MEKKFGNSRSDDRKKRIIIISAIVIAVVVILLLVGSCSRKGSGGDTKDGFVYTQDKNAVKGRRERMSKEETQKMLNDRVDEGMLTISMNLCPVFETGSSEGSLYIFNSDRNRFPQKVTIYMKDSGEKIYESGYIDVGYGIEFAALSVCPEAGEYPCTAYFEAVDESTGAVLGKAGADILIKVLN